MQWMTLGKTVAATDDVGVLLALIEAYETPKRRVVRYRARFIGKGHGIVLGHLRKYDTLDAAKQAVRQEFG